MFNIEYIRTENQVAFYSVISDKFEATVKVAYDGSNPYIRQIAANKGETKLESFNFVQKITAEVLTFEANR